MMAGVDLPPNEVFIRGTSREDHDGYLYDIIEISYFEPATDEQWFNEIYQDFFWDLNQEYTKYLDYWNQKMVYENVKLPFHDVR